MRKYQSFLGILPLIIATASYAHVSSTLDKIKATETFTVGKRDASLPFNYTDDAGKQAGYAWEISERVADEIKRLEKLPNLKIEAMNLTSQTRIPLVANQTVDLECSSTTNNLERQKQVAFSTTFMVINTRLLARKSSHIKDIGDLTGKSVVVEAGTTAERILRKVNSERNLNVNVILAKDPSLVFTTVETGRAVAALDDDIPLYGMIATSKMPDQWEIVGPALSQEAYGCMMRQDDPTFKALVDGVIGKMMASGEMAALYNKYFMQPINVHGGTRIGAPMSSQVSGLYRTPTDKAYQ